MTVALITIVVLLGAILLLQVSAITKSEGSRIAGERLGKLIVDKAPGVPQMIMITDLEQRAFEEEHRVLLTELRRHFNRRLTTVVLSKPQMDKLKQNMPDVETLPAIVITRGIKGDLQSSRQEYRLFPADVEWELKAIISFGSTFALDPIEPLAGTVAEMSVASVSTFQSRCMDNQKTRPGPCIVLMVDSEMNHYEDTVKSFAKVATVVETAYRKFRFLWADSVMQSNLHFPDNKQPFPHIILLDPNESTFLYLPARIVDGKWSAQVLEETAIVIETFDIPQVMSLNDIKGLMDSLRSDFGNVDSQEKLPSSLNAAEAAAVREKRRLREKEERAQRRKKSRKTTASKVTDREL